MAQPIKKTIRTKTVTRKKKVTSRGNRKRRNHPDYGTSKLEERFASEFLDKLGVEYVYQFKAESIGRYFDFRIMPKGPIIEVNGSYWHGDRRIYEEKDLNRTQQKNMKVDELKRRWCSRNGIKIIYVWEKDINEDPEGVMKYLREKLKDFLHKKEKTNKL